MVDVVLIITILVIAVFALVVSVLFVAYFGHTLERGEALFSKLVCIVLLWLTILLVLQVPVEVANVASGRSIPAEYLLLVNVLGLLGFILMCAPFATFFYESKSSERDDTGLFCRLLTSFGTGLAITAVFVIGTVILFVFASDINVDVQVYESPVLGANSTACDSDSCTQSSGSVRFNTSFFVFIILASSLAGLGLVAVFGALGLGSIPVLGVLTFLRRPRRIKGREYATLRTKLYERSVRLREAGVKFVAKSETKPRFLSPGKFRLWHRGTHAYRTAVHQLGVDTIRLERANRLEETNPIIPILRLADGIIAIGFFGIWWLQILLFVVLDVTPFFAVVVIIADQVWPFFGAVIYAVFTLHLLRSVLTGFYVLGVRFGIIPIHPLVPHGSFMSSIIFNLSFAAIASFGVLHMSALAFAPLTQFTAIEAIFISQAMHLSFIRFIWPYFFYVFLGLSLLSPLPLLLRPRPSSVVDVVRLTIAD